MKLYALTNEYQQIADMAENADSEELQTAFRDTLEGLAGEIGQKVLNCAAVVRTLEAQALAVASECERLDKRRASLMNSVKYLKAYMQRGMEAAGQQKVQDDLFTVAIKSTPPAVVMDTEDFNVLPSPYRRVTIEPDKKAIAEELKKGAVLGFAHLETKKTLQIK